MLLSTLLAASIALFSASGATAFSVSQLFKFSNGTFIENIALLPNGHLLLTTFDQGRLYTLDPSAETPEATVVAQLDNVVQLTGIAEIAPYTYAITGGIESEQFRFIELSGRAFTVTFDPSGTKPADVKLVAQDIDAGILNGMVALPAHPRKILSMDSLTGRILRIDTITGTVEVAVQDELLLPGDPAAAVPLGGNGLGIRDGYLYFTNSERQLFARFAIDEYGSKIGEIEEIYRLPEGSSLAFDDFDLAEDGTAFITQQQESVIQLTPDGEVTILVGPDDEVSVDSPTAPLLSADGKTLYIVTGGLATGGGQVVAVKLC
jgi:outer membrane protein assembly factor BamB